MFHNGVNPGPRKVPTRNTYFYFNFASQKEQLPASVLGALLKQAVSGMAKARRKLRKSMKARKRWLDNRDRHMVLSRY